MVQVLSKPFCIALVLLFVAAGCRHEALPVAPQKMQPQREAPIDPLRVRVTGNDFHWHIRYGGPDGSLDTPDDFMTQRHLHLPAETDIELELCSDDFVYSLFLPEYDLWEMAFPGRPYEVQFRSESIGTSKLLGAQMCGYTHEQLLGNLVVQSPADFRRWIETPAAQ